MSSQTRCRYTARSWRALIVCVLVITLAAACSAPTTASSAAPASTLSPLPTYTAYPTYTPAPTVAVTVQQTVPVTVVVIVTATLPAATATPTAAPAAKTYTTQQVIDAFKVAGLDAGNPRPMIRDDYGPAPMMATDATIFELTSLGPDSQGMRHGRVMAFANAADLAITKAYYVTLGKNSALLFSWVYDEANILVQINGDLPQAKAVKYQAALAALTK